MVTATVKQLKDELNEKTPKELVQLCLKLSVFKKENKELLTYLLFESHDEESFREGIKKEVEQSFEEMNKASYFYMKKSCRKILRSVKKYIRYSKNKETEVELLLYFCQQLKDLKPPIRRNRVLQNMFDKQMEMCGKALIKLEEDLQYDYQIEIDKILL